MATTESLERSSVDELADPMTAEQFAEIAPSFELPVELVRGEIVEMPRPKPRHGVVIKNISGLLWQWARQGDHGVIDGESGMITEREPDSVRGPDVFFVPFDRLSDRKVPDHWYETPPALVVEVLSENDRWGDIRAKIDEYFTFGVDEVWVVEPDLKRLDVVRNDRATQSLTKEAVITSDVLPGFECSLSDFFYGC